MTLPTTIDALSAGSAAGAVVAIGAFGRRRLRVAPRPAAPPRRPTLPTRRRSIIRRAVIGTTAIGIGVSMGWVAVVAAAAIWFAVRTARPVVARRTALQAAHRELPDAVERVVLLVHAGLSPHLAIRAAAGTVPGAVRPAFESVVHRLDRGAPLGDALRALPDDLGPRAAPIADAFAAADRYGVPLESVLDQLARDARSERRRLDEADARRLPVRLAFPLVTCTLPSFVLVAIAPAVIAALSSLGTSW